MNIKFSFFIAFAVAKLCMTLCKADSGCPNEPVTPYAIENSTTDLPIPPHYDTTASHIQTTSTEYPNRLTSPSPIEAPSQIKEGSKDCPNLPVTPSPVELTTQTAISAVTSTTTSSENQESARCPTIPPFYFQCQVSNVCSNEIIKMRIDQSNSSLSTTYPISQCCLATCCYQQNCCQTGSQTVTTTTTQPPPPEALIECPPGTQLLGNRCHLLYCPRGSIQINNRCVVIECPLGTVWTGHQCSVSEPIVHNVTFYNTIVTKINQTKPAIILNNTNNIVVNAPLSLHNADEFNSDCLNDYGNCNDAAVTSAEATPASNLKCCEVRTPRICEQRHNRWQCYSRRFRRCGEFCIASIIYLQPSRVHVGPHHLVMPPMQNDCQSNGNCSPPEGEYDCSGCALNNMERCSYYCYRYVCPPRTCTFYDQEKYCVNRFGLYGCQQRDGCFDDWCL